MKRNLSEELKKLEKGILTEEGYASDVIKPENQKARARFLKDAVDIFTICEQTAQTEAKKQKKVKFKNFYQFVRVYLGLVRDTTGTLYAREQALNLTRQKLTADEGLGEEDMKARSNVISLHYLGRVERLFQIIALLKPLSETAFAVGDGSFNREFIHDQLSFARKTLDELFLKEHGISVGEGTLDSIPTKLPPKPLTTSQKKKKKEIEKQQKLVNYLKDQKKQKPNSLPEENVNQENVLPTLEILPPQKKEVQVIKERYSDWFHRTEKSNLKEFKIRVKEQLEKEQRKKNLKQKKKNTKKIDEKSTSNINNSISFDSKDQNFKIEKKEEITENSSKGHIKKVVHAPHKNGSKKLRAHHVIEIKDILNSAGYTSDAFEKREDLKIDNEQIGGNPWKVFQAIHDCTFSGEMDQVTNMIRALGGYVDETRSGSRIGIVLRHAETNKLVGTDLSSLGNDEIN